MKKILLLLFCAFYMLQATPPGDPNWQVNPALYQYSASVVARVSLDNVYAVSPVIKVAAFKGETVRGVASETVIGGQGYFFLTVYSNSALDTLSLKVYLSSTDLIYTSVQTVNFQPDAIVGTVSNPLIINIASPPSITIIYPDNTAVFKANSTQRITWTSNNVENVKIEYSVNNGTNWTTIVESAVSNGRYFWGVPKVQTNQGKIRISSVAAPEVYAQNSGSFTINFAPPLKEDFDDVTVPAIPAGWSVEDANSDTYTWKTSSSYPAKSGSKTLSYENSPSADADDWVFTQGMQLTANKNYQVSFYYRTSGSTGSESFSIHAGTTAQASGMITPAFFSVSGGGTGSYVKVAGDFMPSTTGVYYFGVHCFSTLETNPGTLSIDDFIIRQKPAATSNVVVPPSSTTPVSSPTTGVTIQFTSNISDSLLFVIDKIEANPGGVLPDTLQHISSTYWSANVSGGTVQGTYCMSLDVTGVQGVNDYSTLVLLKRDDASASWIRIGVPTDLSGYPVLKWCYPSLTSFSEFGLGGNEDNPLPVELSRFNGSVKGGNVELVWSTETEVNSHSFEIERKGNTSGDWITIGTVPAFGYSNSPKNYSFTDKNLHPGIFQYRLKMIDSDGSVEYSSVISLNMDTPEKFTLEQNYPNPFNPVTKLRYAIPLPSVVEISIYTITGSKLMTLSRDHKEAGVYETDIDLRPFSSGIYFCRLSAGEKSALIKMTFIK